ncbi:MAG: universal stress protein [Gammaproteobacteria bacterium]|nr:universal stress protein [Gammaproteobacteria bacterium]
MYKRILVAIDGSKISNLALEEAIGLAREMKSQLLLLHVNEGLPAQWEPEGAPMLILPEMLDAIAEAAESLLRKARERAERAGIPVETRLVEALGRRAAQVISEEARKWPADLLVLGTHGRKGFDHLLLGSVAEGVIRTASMPVLLVRQSTA